MGVSGCFPSRSILRPQNLVVFKAVDEDKYVTFYCKWNQKHQVIYDPPLPLGEALLVIDEFKYLGVKLVRKVVVKL